MKKLNFILPVLVFVGGLNQASAQLGANSSGKKSAGANMMGAVVNATVGVGLAFTSSWLCGSLEKEVKPGELPSGAEGPVVPHGTTIMVANPTSYVMPDFGNGPACVTSDPFSGAAARKVGSIVLSAFSVIEYAQAATNVISMAKSGKTADSAAYGAGGAYDAGQFGDINFPGGSTMKADQIGQGLANLSDKMKKNGMGLDVGTGKITMPNGNTVDAAMLNSGDSAGIAKAMGVPKDEVDKALSLTNKLTKDALNKYKNYDLKMAGGGGGGAVGGAGGNSRDPAGLGLDFSKLFGKKPGAKAQVSGLTKIVGGNPVGVAQDDIFQMVQRRYQEKERSDFFYK